MTTFDMVKKWAWQWASIVHSPDLADEDKQMLKNTAYEQIDLITKVHNNSDDFRKSMENAFKTYDEYLKFKINDEVGKERMRESEKHFNTYLYG